jgi:hypothetical protein
MAIFKKNEDKPEKLESTSAPVGEESPQEAAVMDKLNTEVEAPVEASAPVETNYREIRLSMSQTEINNVVLENNNMLREILSKLQ